MSARIFHIYIYDQGSGTFGVALEFDGPTKPVQFTPQGPFDDAVNEIHDRSAARLIDPYKLDKACEFIGSSLFASFIAGPVSNEYAHYRAELQAGASPENRMPRIAVHLPRSLQYIPWEVLKDPNDPPGQFISLRGSLIRYDLASEKRTTPISVEPTVESKPQFVVVVSNPTDRVLYNFSLDRNYKGATFIQVTPAEFEKFRDALAAKAPLGVIFFGHGEVDVKQREGYLFFVKRVRSGLFSELAEDRRAAHAIGKELGIGAAPRLAYVLACESALVENAVDFERTVAGTLVTSTLTGAVIGAQEKIDQKALMTLLKTCIDDLVAGVPLDLSLRKARLDILSIDPGEREAQFSRLDWWIPTLYARTQNFDVVRSRARSSRRQLPKMDRASVSVAGSGTLTSALGPALRHLATQAWGAVSVRTDTPEFR